MEGRLRVDAELDEVAAQELVDELHDSKPTDVLQLRDRAAVHISTDVVVRPANIADRDACVVSGKSRELQRQGGCFVLDRPLEVGSLFHVTFEDDTLGLGAALAICDRCSMLSETVFESHLRFYDELDMRHLDVRDPLGGEE